MVVQASTLRNWLNDSAISAGFHSLHVTDATLPDTVGKNLQKFLAQKLNGDMSWLADTAMRRCQPAAMWPDATTAIVLTVNYAPDHDPMDNICQYDRGNISVYAADVIIMMLLGKIKLASQFASRPGANVRVFVDTAPLMENH